MATDRSVTTTEQARHLYHGCLCEVAIDIELRMAAQVGVLLWTEGPIVKEIVTRWPEFMRWTTQQEEFVGFRVPPAEAVNFVRTLARAAMH